MEENKISEEDYKPDFEILDRYISFSSEILRLSLFGISGFGVLLLYGNKAGETKLLNSDTTYALFIAVIFLGISAGLALSHRFFATDSMSYHISYLRKKNPNERIGRNSRLKLSGWILISAEVSFGIGILLFATGIYQMLPQSGCTI